MNDDLCERNRDIVRIKEKFEFSVHIPLDLEAGSLLALGNKLERNAGSAEFGNALIKRSLDNVGNRVADLLEVILNDRFDSFDRFTVFDLNDAGHESESVSQVDDGSEVGVIHNFEVSGGILKTGRSDADLAHGSAEAVDYDDISDVEDIFKYDEESRNDVFDKRLRSETDDKRQNSDAGEKRTRVNTADLEGRKQKNENGEIFDERTDQIESRLPFFDKSEHPADHYSEKITDRYEEETVTYDPQDPDAVTGFAERIDASVEYTVCTEDETAEDKQDEINRGESQKHDRAGGAYLLLCLWGFFLKGYHVFSLSFKRIMLWRSGLRITANSNILKQSLMR